MSNIIQIKRRTSGAAGAPDSLATGELAYNEIDNVLYIGKSDESIFTVGGVGAFLELNTDQTATGDYTFSGDVDFTGATTLGNVQINGAATLSNGVTIEPGTIGGNGVVFNVGNSSLSYTEGNLLACRATGGGINVIVCVSPIEFQPDGGGNATPMRINSDGLRFSDGTTQTTAADATVASTGSYNDLSDTPALSTVATSGSYTDLSNKPQIVTVAPNWTLNHTLADGTRYLVNDVVYSGGNVYKALYDNESEPVTNATYWLNLGAGSRINIDGRDIPNIPYPVTSVNGQTGAVTIGNPFDQSLNTGNDVSFANVGVQGDLSLVGGLLLDGLSITFPVGATGITFGDGTTQNTAPVPSPYTAGVGLNSIQPAGVDNTASGDYSTVAGGLYNSANDFYSVVAGGTDNVAGGHSSFVGGGNYNTATNIRTTIGGGFNNVASADSSTVGGGNNNNASGPASTIGGGQGNIASGSGWSTVCGGKNNTASGYHSTVSGGTTNTASGFYSTVGGGLFNTASGYHSTVSGGTSNIASGPSSFVGGGVSNQATNSSDAVVGGYLCVASGGYSFVGSGLSNNASGTKSVVGGGTNNTASAYYSTVSGGRHNTASGFYSTVGGGSQNTASGTKSVVGGGQYNTVSGNYSTVSGGRHNTASGYGSTISGGLHALASHHGEQAQASGKFAEQGDAQKMSLVARRETTDDTASQELFLDNYSARLTIPTLTAWNFTVRVAAYSCTDNAAASWNIRGLLKNDSSNNVSLVGSNISESWKDTSLDSAIAVVVADDTNDALSIQVTGISGLTIRWVADIEITQVRCAT